MATAHKKGNADIVYTPLGGTQAIHVLALPLLVSPRENFMNTRGRTRFEGWNADGTEREVFKVGQAVDEIEARVRMEDDPAGLKTVLAEALENNITLTYRPDGSTEYPALLVSAGGRDGGIRIFPDPDRFGFGEWAANLVLRRVDGGDFDGLL